MTRGATKPVVVTVPWPGSEEEPRGVELVVDVAHAQEPVERDRREEQAHRQQHGAECAEHQKGPPRVT